MKIIRVLWGNKINNEIPKIPLLKNEVVYVWGKENNKMLLNQNLVNNDYLKKEDFNNKNIFIKGSRSNKLEKILDIIN